MAGSELIYLSRLARTYVVLRIKDLFSIIRKIFRRYRALPRENQLNTRWSVHSYHLLLELSTD